MFAVIFICGNLFLPIAGKTAQIAKIRTCKRATRYKQKKWLEGELALLLELPIMALKQDRMYFVFCPKQG